MGILFEYFLNQDLQDYRITRIWSWQLYVAFHEIGDDLSNWTLEYQTHNPETI